MRAPAFTLKGVDGAVHTLDSVKGAKATIVLFSCNHCPDVMKAEDEFIAVFKKYHPLGVGMAAINANNSDAYPEDSFENMAARAADKKFPFFYLRDASQLAAKAYGATHTPQLFVFGHDLKLAYTGSIASLRPALDDLVASRPVREPETQTIGCTIKWK